MNGDRFQPGDGAFGTGDMGQSDMHTFFFFHFIFSQVFVYIKDVVKNHLNSIKKKSKYNLTVIFYTTSSSFTEMIHFGLQIFYAICIYLMVISHFTG